MKSNSSDKKLRTFLSNQSSLLVLIALCIVMSLVYDRFLTSRNIMNVLRQNSMLGIATIGLTYVVLTGGIDLSMPSVAALSGCLFASLSVYGFVPALLAALACATFWGWFNGFIITRTKIAPFIVTLVVFYAVKGIVYLYTGNGASISVVDSPAIEFISRKTIFGVIPTSFLIFLLCALVSACVLRWSKFGRYLLAVGGNEEAARFMGIDVNRVKVLAYTLSGSLTGLGGVILAARLVAAQPVAGEGWDMQALAAIVVGGTLLTGGKGSFIGSVFGTLVMAVVLNAISLQSSLSSWWQWIVRGAFILIVVTIQGVASKRKAHI